MATTTEQLGKHLAGGGDNLIGAIVMWSLAGFSVPRAAFREYFDGLGLAKAVGATPGAVAMARLSVSDSRTGLKDQLLREVGETKDSLKIAVVHERREVADSKVEHAQRSLITLDKATGEMVLEDEADPVALRVRARYEQRRTHALTDEVSTCVVRALTGTRTDPMLAGLRLAGRGGSYFVTPEAMPRLRALQAWLHENGDSGTLVTILEVFSNESNLEGAAKVARASLVAETRSVLNEVRGYVAELGAKDAEAVVPERVIQTRIKRLDTLTARSTLYASVLGDLREEVMAELAEAKRAVLGLSGTKASELEQKEAELDEAFA
jgi:hypothetical protein